MHDAERDGAAGDPDVEVAAIDAEADAETDADVSAEVAAIERAMVALRRSAARRTLARRAERQAGAPVPGGAAFDVLDVVEAAEERGEPAGVREVADALRVDQPRASKLVAAAVQAGHLRREADQTDGRRTLLAVTPDGRELLETVHTFRRAMVARVTRDWPAADRAAFARLFTRFMDDFGAASGAPGTD
ncbi:MarR family winged helix-turn-helix transcriptional regulator [Streptomyces decoyicus]|uniref:MarR family winged helix-turn-helix transcriptional regulator n=1 Tax=Streptomyces decoyicus TaxID=249567 RepID=A0ABZ1FPP3_9ACTN|nr:MarR family winged helix-turn-helix transcriptional regulator [Streptomyces decoyicus]WSB72414.1 MarR family winged helix-turn-helix transcriptional regulator [Streptomyces decoyicus]